jgi:hypothetical protein
LNIIGTTGASPAARSFVQGINQDGSNPGANGRFPWAITDTRQEVIDYGMSGDVFENWAGKVSVATGFQYREEALVTRTDCASRGNCANEVFGGTLYGPAGNPLLNPASVNVNGQTFPGFPNWYAGNFQPARSVFHEWETFLETNIPLLDNPEWGRINANPGRPLHPLHTTSAMSRPGRWLRSGTRRWTACACGPCSRGTCALPTWRNCLAAPASTMVR